MGATNSTRGSTPTVVKIRREAELKKVSASSKSPRPPMVAAKASFIADQVAFECVAPASWRTRSAMATSSTFE